MMTAKCLLARIFNKYIIVYGTVIDATKSVYFDYYNCFWFSVCPAFFPELLQVRLDPQS